jgi:hypothetical protein
MLPSLHLLSIDGGVDRNPPTRSDDARERLLRALEALYDSQQPPPVGPRGERATRGRREARLRPFYRTRERQVANAHELCAICQELLVDKTDPELELRELPCGHEFHKVCVDTWLSLEPRCPTCNAEARPSPIPPLGGLPLIQLLHSQGLVEAINVRLLASVRPVNPAQAFFNPYNNMKSVREFFEARGQPDPASRLVHSNELAALFHEHLSDWRGHFNVSGLVDDSGEDARLVWVRTTGIQRLYVTIFANLTSLKAANDEGRPFESLSNVRSFIDATRQRGLWETRLIRLREPDVEHQGASSVSGRTRSASTEASVRHRWYLLRVQALRPAPRDAPDAERGAPDAPDDAPDAPNAPAMD